MLATLNDVFTYAEKHSCAIGAFNTPTLENVIGIIENAESLNIPVIIAHAQCHEKEAPLDVIGPVMVYFAKKAKVQVCVHLDHGEDIDYIHRALDLGFTSVMYDGSTLSYKENVKNTAAVVKLAKQYGASVEGEIGALAAREGGDGEGKAVYTEPDDAAKFVKDTKIDALACSFGTAHGIYKVAPKLDFERIEKIHKLIKIPLVMHGGSGLSHEDYRMAMDRGVLKINAYSYIGKTGVMAAKDIIDSGKITFYHEMSAHAKQAMKEYSLHMMKVMAKLAY